MQILLRLTGTSGGKLLQFMTKLSEENVLGILTFLSMHIIYPVLTE
jgi:hypothetical protein